MERGSTVPAGSSSVWNHLAAATTATPAAIHLAVACRDVGRPGQIIRAAADSLLENGYSGTSVRAIASKAGVAIGNLQYWFPTKSELLVEAWRYLTSKSVEELRRTLNQLTDPLEVLEIGVESLWDSLRRLGDVQLAAFDLLVQAPRTERLRAYLPELFTRYREVIQEQLDRLEDDGRIRLTVPRDVLVPLAGRQRDRADRMIQQTLDRELDRLQDLWSDGLSDTYRAYLDHVHGFAPEVQQRLALAAALIEVGVRLQGLGGRAAPPTTLLMGDLCLARGSRLLADSAPLAVQVAFARAIELVSAAAASEQPAPATRVLLQQSLEAAR